MKNTEQQFALEHAIQFLENDLHMGDDASAREAKEIANKLRIEFEIPVEKEDNKVVIETFGEETEFSLYNEAGTCIEADFSSPEEAKSWAVENGFEVVESFNI